HPEQRGLVEQPAAQLGHREAPPRGPHPQPPQALRPPPVERAGGEDGAVQRGVDRESPGHTAPHTAPHTSSPLVPRIVAPARRAAPPRRGGLSGYALPRRPRVPTETGRREGWDPSAPGRGVDGAGPAGRVAGAPLTAGRPPGHGVPRRRAGRGRASRATRATI